MNLAIRLKRSKSLVTSRLLLPLVVTPNIILSGINTFEDAGASEVPQKPSFAHHQSPQTKTISNVDFGEKSDTRRLKMFSFQLPKLQFHFDTRSWALGVGFYFGQYFDIQILCLDIVFDFSNKKIVHGDLHGTNN